MSQAREWSRSYNRISVDGDTSTNDMVAVLANGASGIRLDAKTFERALAEVRGIAGATDRARRPRARGS